jgi:hypothetical protein
LRIQLIAFAFVAMELYSRAFRLDADVEHKVDQRLLATRIQALIAETNGSFPALEQPTPPCNQLLLDALIQNPNNRHIGHLAVLPEDVLQRVLAELGFEHVVALELIARCCRGLYAECRGGSCIVWSWLWRHCFACTLSNSSPILDHAQFLALPKLRTDGLYISRITYFRQGYEEGAVYQPFHVVTYYRYLRFWQLPLNSAMCRLAVALVTTDKPSVAIERLRAVPIDAIKAVQSRFPRAHTERTPSRSRTPLLSRPSTPRASTPVSPAATPNLFVGQYWRVEGSAEETMPSMANVSRDFKLRLYDAQSTQPLHLAMHMRIAVDPSRHHPHTAVRTPPLQCLRYAARRSGASIDERVDFDVGNWGKFHFSRVKSYHT